MTAHTKRLSIGLVAVCMLLNLLACFSSAAPTEAPALTDECRGNDIRTLTADEIEFERVADQNAFSTVFQVIARYGPFVGVSEKRFNYANDEPIDMIGGLDSLRAMELEALDILNEQIRQGAIAINALRPVNCPDAKG